MEKILTDVTKEQIIKFQQEANHNNVIIIKFGATWCGPCQRIKELCYNWFNIVPAIITCIDVDIDEHLELYIALKAKKMVKGVPTLLAYYGGRTDHWFIPNDSICGADIVQVNKFFERCVAQTLK